MNDNSPWSALQSLKGLSFLDAPRLNKTELQLFQDWLESAKGGSIYHYATATWLDERKKHSMQEYVYSDDSRATASAAWKAYEEGLVELAQKRNEKGTFDYLAQKRKVRREPEKPVMLRGHSMRTAKQCQPA
jgi:hypothetical protein